MAYGNEVILGFSLNQYCKLIGKKIPSINEFENDQYINDTSVLEKLLPQVSISNLLQAQENALIKAGICKGGKWGDRYFNAKTPKGIREFAPLSLEIIGDTDEIGDEYPDDFVVGISISGRYFPTYLDWKDEHGTIETIGINDIGKLVSIIKDEIVKVIPMFKDSQLFIKMRHY